MAIYLEFEKETESETEVVYRFGGATDPLAHTVRIPKADPSRTILPAGVGQALTGSVVGRASMVARREGSWPDRGLIQS